LCSIFKVASRPICIGIFSSERSLNRELPSPEVFLKKFLDDLEILSSRSIYSNDKVFKLTFGKLIFVCDTPIRSYLKKIKSHSGYSSCERCSIVGVYDHLSSHVCLVERGRRAVLRNNDNFLAQRDADHHQGTSVLVLHGINMVHEFVLDYMHLACLGVTKRLLLFWKGMRR